MAKALITGVAGFIGSHIAKELLKDKHDVIGVDDLSAGYDMNIPDGVEFYRRDICDIHKYSAILKNVDVIFHNAASKKTVCLADPIRDLQVNAVGTLRLLTEAVDKGVNKFVHASTGSVYGEHSSMIVETSRRNPVSYYGISKLAGENYVMLFSDKINVTVLRYFHVWGSHQESADGKGGVVAIFSRRILAGEPIIINGDGNQRRVFTHVSDIVRANLEVWRNPVTKGQIYNCASSVQTTINELAELLMNFYDRRVNKIYTTPTPGDIYNFYVNTLSIERLGVSFKPINQLL